VGNSNASSMDDVSWVSGAWPIWHSIVEYMISLGMIQQRKNIIPSWVYMNYSCLDIRCLQKEATYMKDPNSIKSRTKDGIYYLTDFFGKITSKEKEKWKIQ
jgi:hypothetical protein